MNATVHECGSCLYEDAIDDCGECGGTDYFTDGLLPNGDCDCDGNKLDCAGECGGIAEIDCEDVCNGVGCFEQNCDEYPSDHYDCSGVCLVDSDGDDTCDGLEIYGCTDDGTIPGLPGFDDGRFSTFSTVQQGNSRNLIIN